MESFNFFMYFSSKFFQTLAEAQLLRVSGPSHYHQALVREVMAYTCDQNKRSLTGIKTKNKETYIL